MKELAALFDCFHVDHSLKDIFSFDFIEPVPISLKLFHDVIIVLRQHRNIELLQRLKPMSANSSAYQRIH